MEDTNDESKGKDVDEPISMQTVVNGSQTDDMLKHKGHLLYTKLCDFCVMW